MKKQKFNDLIAVFLVQLVLTLPLLSANAYGLVISEVKANKVTQNSAAIEWKTDVPANGTVKYGKTNALGQKQKHTNFVTAHSLEVSGLSSNTEFLYSVESSDSSGNAILDDNSGAFYKFKTLGDAVEKENAQEAKPDDGNGHPSIDVSIPSNYNRRSIDIAGTTRQFSSVSLFVNDLTTPKKSLSGNEVGGTGRFYFRQVQLSDTNTIKIEVIDKNGNKNEQLFEVAVDTEEPIIKLEEISQLLSKPNFTVSGTSSEPVLAKVFVDLITESAAPAQIKGLKAEKISQNSIELKWDQSKDKDFSHYVVYRDSVAIALTKPANYNYFIDALADTNKEYKYEVSAVNTFGKEGQKSEPLAAKTLSGGQSINIPYPPVEVSGDFAKPSMALEVQGNFNFEVKLDKGDGSYRVKFIFEDKAGNKFSSEKLIELDTKKPTVKILSPSSGSFIYENYANEVTITGKTKPNARVHLFIDRLPLSLYDKSLEVGGLPNEAFGTVDSQNFPKPLDADVKTLDDRLQGLSEKELESKCPRGGNCEGADRSVASDKEGNFKFDKVDLAAAFAFATRLRQVPVPEFRDIQLNKEARDSKKTTIYVIATDRLGQRGMAKQTVNIGTCWSGNQSWDIIPLTQYQSPTFLSTERLSEGSEAIYFFFNYTYIGRGANAQIKSVSLQRACSTRELLDPRFNISCSILQQGDYAAKINPDGTLTYSAVPLNRFEGMDRFLEADWKNFFKAINNEMTFPFKVMIRYKHDIIDDTGQVREAIETQTACQEVTYVVDNTLIDPRSVLPDFLLYDFVDFLQKSVNALTKVQEQVDRVIDYVAIGCLYTFFAHLVYKIFRNWIELSNELQFKLKNALVPIGNSQEDEYCKSVAEAVVQGYQLGSLRNLKLRYFSDPDLKKCFPAVYNAWQRETSIYQWKRWSCDRIFGHATPSRWTEKETDDELYNKINTQETCAQDGAERGLKVPVTECRKLEGKYREIFYPGNHEPFDRKCFEIQYDEKNPLEFYVFTIYPEDQEPQLTANGIYKLKRYEKRPEDKPIYVKKIDENYYLTAQPQTCEQVCGVKEKKSSQQIKAVGGQTFTLVKEKPTVFVQNQPAEQKPEEQGKTKPEDVKLFGCVTRNQCRAWLANSDPKADGLVLPGLGLENDKLTKYSVQFKGYTSDCFYEYGDDPNVVSETNPNTREICCCINGKLQSSKDFYYQPNDRDEKIDGILGREQYIHESKSGNPRPTAQPEDPQGYSDMQFSYRYSIIGYLNKKYNPNRYISGRDLPACFGQDNQFYKIFGKADNLVMINPFKQDTATLQCAYLTGINQRLQMFKNIMSAMSNCLIDIRKDGRADAGACKELFTQHVCGLMWQLVQFFRDGCTPDFEGEDSEAHEAKFGEKIKLGLKGISQGITEAQNEMASEYQNVKLNNLLGIGQGGVARKICLGAFGYDWDLSARNLIDAAYTSPFATLVQPITQSREFLTIDPITLRARYEYRASWIVNPGCDLENYKVDLACISRNELDRYPNDINCGSVGAPSIASTGALGTSTAYNECDCLKLPGEKTRSFFQVPRLKQNQLSDPKDRHEVFEDNYRYDHIKFTLRTDRKITPEMRKNCFPPGHEDGVFYRPINDKTARDLLDCTVDPLSGVFKCGEGTSFFASRGIAQILEVTINDINPETAKKDELEFQVGKPLVIKARVTKTGPPKCFRVTISPDFIQDRFEKIELDGESNVGPIEITNQLDIQGRGNYESPGIPIEVESQDNSNIVAIETQFIDNPNIPSSEDRNTALHLYSKDDTVKVEGFDIDLAGSQFINVNTNDPSIEYDPANTPNVLIVKKEGKISKKITLEGDKVIRIEKEGAVVVIRNVYYLEKETKYPGTNTNMWMGGGTIKIYPRQQSATSQQKKTITVGIYNMKLGKDDSYNYDDCHINDKAAVEKKWDILVTKQGAKAEAIDPRIGTIEIEKKKQIIGQDVVVSSRITHPLGIEKVTVEIKGPTGSNVDDFNSFMSGPVTDMFTVTYPTDNKPKGIYTGTITATSKPETDGKEGKSSNQRFSFELIEPRQQ